METKGFIVLCSNGLYNHDNWQFFKIEKEAIAYKNRVKNNYQAVHMYPMYVTVEF